MLLAVLLSALCASAVSAQFDDVNANIDWKTLGDLRSPDFSWEENTKPVMFLFTQPWCGACTRLKETLRADGDGKTRMEEFAKHFVMVSVAGEENEDIEDDFKPDGGYIPRVLFADKHGKVDPNLTFSGNPKYKYFYTSAAQLANAMEEALTELGVDLNAAAEEELEVAEHDESYEAYGEEEYGMGDEGGCGAGGDEGDEGTEEGDEYADGEEEEDEYDDGEDDAEDAAEKEEL